MTSADLVLWVPLGLAGLAALAPALARALGRNAGYPLAVVFGAATVALGSLAPGVLAGRPVERSVRWVPSLGVDLSFRLDELGFLFAMLVLGIGALVMAYSARYLTPGGGYGRLYGLLTLFAASMLALVLADDLFLLFIAWELTSVTSFFLIGGTGTGRTEATRAFLVTALGGLVLLAGLVLIAVVSGTSHIGTVLADPSVVRDHSFAIAIGVLLLVGAFTKSAQVPFHFWLPGAMVAPTPVSTYLHAATMVKAGIYLVARFSPIFAGTPWWRTTVVLVGLTTAVIGAGLALKQHDLKALLAYSTVSQLGFIMALVGIGTFAAMAAAMVHLFAHALYKATLFMVVGIIDREAGSRDIRELSGLRKMMPFTALVTAFAAVSMAGFPPFLGFASKEAAFDAFLGVPGAWLAAVATVLGVSAAIMTFAYGARIFDGTFEGPPRQRLYDPAPAFLGPAVVPALAGLGLGMGLSLLDPLAGGVARRTLGVLDVVHLELWHGFAPSLGLSVLTVTAGTLMFLARGRVDRVLARTRWRVPGAATFDAAQRGIFALGRAAGRPFLSSSAARQVAWISSVLLVTGTGAWLARGGALPAVPRSSPQDWAVAALLVAALIGAIRTRSRLAAAGLIGVTGFLVAVLFVLFGAPDLALTQLLVETLTVTLIVLVFRRLPPRFAEVARARKIGAAVAGAAVAVAAFAATLAFTGREHLSEAASYYLTAAPEQAGGNNVVNTILVDFRALDTLGEITVLAAAALGVLGLVRLAGRAR